MADTSAVRDALFNNSWPINDEDGIEQDTDLTIIPWSRTTVADGQWLQNHAIAPLSARDLYLADCLQAALDQIAVLSAQVVELSAKIPTEE